MSPTSERVTNLKQIKLEISKDILLIKEKLRKFIERNMTTGLKFSDKGAEIVILEEGLEYQKYALLVRDLHSLERLNYHVARALEAEMNG